MVNSDKYQTNFALETGSDYVSGWNSVKLNKQSFVTENLKVATKMTEGSGFFGGVERRERIKVRMLLILDFQLLVTHYKQSKK